MNENPQSLYPLLFEPVLKDYIWGGHNLQFLLGRELPNGKVAESWEIAAHEDGTSVVTNGIYAGLPLTAVHELLGLNLIGRNNSWAQDRNKFPLLVKLLDAHDKLSIQVHPDDIYALANEGNELGKTEMWFVLHAEPEAKLIIGVGPGITPDMFRDAIINGTPDLLLNSIPVTAGDFVCVPSGTVHAILGGIVIAEIQQNSNTTYRVYDWNRTVDGKARPLHVAKALDVINFNATAPEICPPTLVDETSQVQRWLLCRNRYFTTERIELAAGAEYAGDLDGKTLEIWGVISGAIGIGGIDLESVRFTLLPAAMGPFEVTAVKGATCLRTYVEELA